MRRAALLPLALLALVLVLLMRLRRKVTTVAALRAAVATDDPVLERWAPFVCDAVADVFGNEPKIARACMSILNNELPGGARRGELVIIGDKDLPGGPSIGPMQVYRATAKDLRLWSPPPDVAGEDPWEREVYASIAHDPEQCIRWGVEVFRAKLQVAGGELDDAIRRYNGGGTAAAKYRDRALAFADATWGGLDGLGIA
jgi:hypothetical protein